VSWKLRYYLNDELFLEEIHPTRADVIRVACEKFPMHIRAPNYCWQDLTENGYADLGSGGVVIIEDVVSAIPRSHHQIVAESFLKRGGKPNELEDGIVGENPATKPIEKEK
tara:strand:+ start:277 stop:609 length:333 start_codon:yes stop_codon:yes gene_type:complete